MNEKEKRRLIYQTIKNNESGIGMSAEQLSKQLNIPIKEVERILANFEEAYLLDKTKADCYDKIKGRYGVLLYSISDDLPF